MITQEETREIVEKFGAGAQDSGSTPVQIAILTKRISNLAPHFEKNKHDFHSKVGLMKLIGRRRRLLRYLNKTDKAGYDKLIKALGLRK
jgi:small subunit ribosomal protein S15